MSHYRRINLLKSLSKSDIDELLDQYGGEQNQHPLIFGNEEIFKNPRIVNIDDCGLSNFEATGLQNEWNVLFSGKFIQKLKNGALNGNVGTNNFRSICWRVFWNCLSEDKFNWVNDVNESRMRYDDIRNKYVIDPYVKDDQVDLEIHHPLSQSKDSVWHQYFQDNELRDTIMQDLDRLFPEIQFFQQECVKAIILHVLFCYARENPQVQYKQGMHEILAPLIYIMLLNSLLVKESKENLSEEMKVIMDLVYLEHDAYVLFFKIMETIKPWFANLQQPTNTNQVTAISRKLTSIQCQMLEKYDSVLEDHLEKIEVTPQLYGIRWVRLLFGREFSLHRLLILWDAIFAEGIDLVDYIFLAMLINLRGVLLQSDFNICLGYLMKYPDHTDTKYILKRALSLKKKDSKESDLEIIASHVADHMEKNICDINTNAKPIFYSSRDTDNIVEQSSDPSSVRTDISGIDPSLLRYQCSNSLGKQISSIKNKVGSTPQIISRLSDSLKTKHTNKRFVNPSTVEALIEDHAHLQKQVSELQNHVDKMGTISLFCGGKMDLYISILQQCLMKTETCGELEVHTFAGLKQIRDVLKDGLENCGTLPDYEDDFRDIDEHIADASNELTAEYNRKIGGPSGSVEFTHPNPEISQNKFPVNSEAMKISDYFDFDSRSYGVGYEMSRDNDTASVDVVYFNHEQSSQNENPPQINESCCKISNTGNNIPNVHSKSDLFAKNTENRSIAKILATIEDGEPPDLDPLSAFQIDLASCVDISDDD